MAVLLPSFLLFKYLVGKYREHVFAKLEQWKFFQMLKASKLWSVYQLFRP